MQILSSGTRGFGSLHWVLGTLGNHRATYAVQRTYLATGLMQLHQAAFGARNGTTNNHDTFFAVNFDDAQVLYGHAGVAHVARHLLAFENFTGLGTTTDGTPVTEVLVGTVRGAKAFHVVTLHHTGETAAFAHLRYQGSDSAVLR